MKHMAFGKFAILGAFVVAGCYSYPSENINNSNFNTVQADPSFSHVAVGDSDQMLVRLVNDANNGTVTSFVVNNTNAGISVHYNPNYRPYQDATTDTLANQTDKAQQEYYIVGNVPGTYTFTLTPTSVNTSVSATVTVVVLPSSLGAALSVHSITSGDSVTVHAPAGTVFSQSSVVTVGADTVAILSRAADSSSITFAVAATPTSGISSPVTVTEVGVSSSPATQVSTLVTADSLTAPALAPVTLIANGAANPGDTVTLTVPAYEMFTATSVVSFSAGPNGAIVTRTPQLLKVLVGPGDSGSATVTNIHLTTSAALGTYTLIGTGNLHIANVSGAPTTVSNTAPMVGQSITVTLGASLRFTSNSQILIGGSKAGISSVSADSSTATVVPFAYSSGAITYTNIVLSFLNSVPLSLNGDKSVTVASTVWGGPTNPNITAVATAPTDSLVGGQTIVLGDSVRALPCNAAMTAALGGGSTCVYYKITIKAGAVTASLRWDTGSSDDMGIFLAKSDGSACAATIADTQGQVPGNVGDETSLYNCAENATLTPAAGTYLLVVANFGYTGAPWPAWFQARFSQP